MGSTDSLIPKPRTTKLPGWVAPLVGGAALAAIATAVSALVEQRGTEVKVVEVRADVVEVRADVKANEQAIKGIRTLAHEQAKVQVRTEGHVSGINAKLEDISKTMDRLEKQQRRRQ